MLGAVGAHKTSMLQDLERGRSREIDVLVTAVQEMGRLVDLKTPTIDIVPALSKAARARGRMLPLVWKLLLVADRALGV